MTTPPIAVLIERSSLGEAAVKAIRARTPDSVAQEIVQRAELRRGAMDGRPHSSSVNSVKTMQPEAEKKEVSPMTKRSSGNGGPNRRNVTPSGNGDWAVNRPGASRASSVHPTQAEAIRRARESLSRDGGGELTVHGRDGRIRDSDTVAPGNDPSPPKDAK